MSKLRCICGNTIVDQSDNLSYKGYILPDIQLYNASDTLSDAIDSLSNATNKDQRLEWINANFAVPPYPTDLSDSDMVHDIISKFLIEKTLQIFECQKCSHIAIQVGSTNRFKFYKPTSDDTKDMLGEQHAMI